MTAKDKVLQNYPNAHFWNYPCLQLDGSVIYTHCISIGENTYNGLTIAKIFKSYLTTLSKH